MTAPGPRRAVEERLRAFLTTEAEHAMTLTDTDAELRRFHDRISAGRSTRRTWVAAAAAAAVVAAAGGAALIDAGGTDGPPQPTRVAAAGTLDDPVPLPDSLVRTDVGLRDSLTQGAFPAAGSLWHVARNGMLERIDPTSGEVAVVNPGVLAFPPVAEAAGLAWFPGGSGNRQRFYALDPASGQIVRQTPLVESARWIAHGPAGLWAVTGPRALTELDPETGEVLRTISTENGLYDVLVGQTRVYAGPPLNSTGVTVVDVSTGQSRVVLPKVAASSLVLTGDGDLWIQDGARQALVRFHGDTFAEQASVPLPLPTSRGAIRSTYWAQDGRRVNANDGWGEEGHAFLAVTDDALYASLNPGGTPLLLRADVISGSVTHVFSLGDGNSRGPVTVAEGSLWLDWEPGDDLLRRVVEFD